MSLLFLLVKFGSKKSKKQTGRITERKNEMKFTFFRTFLQCRLLAFKIEVVMIN